MSGPPARRRLGSSRRPDGARSPRFRDVKLVIVAGGARRRVRSSALDHTPRDSGGHFHRAPRPSSARSAITTRLSSAKIRSGAVQSSATEPAAPPSRSQDRWRRTARTRAGQCGASAADPRRTPAPTASAAVPDAGPHPAERIDVVTARSACAIVLIVRSRLARSASIECSARRSRSACCVRSRATARQAPNPVQRIKRPNHSASPSRW